MKYKVIRQCCFIGNCPTCHMLPYGKHIEVVQGETNIESEAIKCRKNWAEYKAVIKKDGE